MLDPDDPLTPKVGSPSMILAVTYADECVRDAERCEAAARDLLDHAHNFRQLHKAFSAWQHGNPGSDLKNQAYAKLADTRVQMNEVLR